MAKKILRQLFLAKSQLKYGFKVAQKHNKSSQSVIGYRNVSTDKSALVSYLVDPVICHYSGVKLHQFSGQGSGLSVLRAIASAGYRVDLVAWDTDSFDQINQDYDIVIVHGGKNYHQIKGYIRPHSLVVYLSTGSYWKFHNRQEELRFKSLFTRRGVKLPFDRYIDHPEEEASRRADLIVCFGNQAMIETYSGFKNVRAIPTATYQIGKRNLVGGSLSAERIRSFVFFSGGGNVHKGLDLALEALAHTDINLHICTELSLEFENEYRAELSAPNIHYYGFVEQNSNRFNEIIQQCAFTILPSCSEGGAGSVVDCMGVGLVPIVTKHVGIDTDGLGFLTSSTDPKVLRQELQKIAQTPIGQVETMSRRAHKFVQDHCRPEDFEATLTGYIVDLVTESKFKS